MTDLASRAEQRRQYSPNIKFSHFGFAVHDLATMEDFYTRVLGFTVTDRGEALPGMDLIFLSRDPRDHHQVVLVSGKPDGIPEHPIAPQFGSVINQISFQVGSLANLRELHEIFLAENVQSIFPVQHGIAWSIYIHDPEGNNLEFFVDTEWYFPQPFLEPLDLSMSDDEIYAATKRIAEAKEGMVPYTDWRATMGRQMLGFTPGA